ncbi:hypothetical protein ABZ759_17865 [Streptomyces sp. NPDC047860]|uniref:hypothetical protein n=1 Tax=Streptomyces sp. NPDC047860 TaxID=3155743 RepID=UPI0033C235FE
MNRTTSAAASALSLLTALSLTACGGADTDPDGTTGEPRPSTSRAKQLTPAERLAKLMLTSADVTGYKVTEPSEDFVFAKSKDEVTLDKPACAPLAHAMNQLPLEDPEADLTRVVDTDKYGDASSYITLTTYAAGGAQEVMSGLGKAVDACGSGFTAKADGTSAYDSVASEEPTDGAGDETVAFNAKMTFQGASHTLHTQATRSGDTVAVHFSVNGFSLAQGRPSDAKLPAAVVKAQKGNWADSPTGPWTACSHLCPTDLRGSWRNARKAGTVGWALIG